MEDESSRQLELWPWLRHPLWPFPNFRDMGDVPERNDNARGVFGVESPIRGRPVPEPVQQQRQMQLQRHRPQQPEELEQPLLRLIDENEWIRIHGLAAEPRYGNESYLNQQETLERLQQELEYQRETHSRAFKDDDPYHRKRQQSEEERRRNLEAWNYKVAVLQVSPNRVVPTNLSDLARNSDMIYSMAVTQGLFQRTEKTEKDEGRNNESTTKANEPPEMLFVSLNDFSKDAVESFLTVLLQDAGNRNFDTIVSDHLVDCCRLAHYLQCDSLLQQLVDDVLLPSIDSENCLSLCQLADQLGLHTLLEASMNHMLWTLDKVQDDVTWKEYLTPELQTKMEEMKQILQSSNRKKLFFTTFTEYLAMLAEQYQYYKERLEDAYEQQQVHEPETQGWIYAQNKIRHQVQKVETLRRFVNEQKRLFGGRAGSSKDDVASFSDRK